jgi:superfamily II DNA helicase RecQ
MRVKLLTLRFSPSLGGFDDRPLHELLAGVQLVRFREHFYAVHGVPHLTCVLAYQDDVVDGATLARPTSAGGGKAAAQDRRDGRPDPTVELDERGRALFQALRAWRAETAREEGVPPYVVMTNRQLVEIIQRRPDTPTALGHIPSIGAGKVKRYGRSILRVLGTRVAGGRAQAACTVDAAQAACAVDAAQAAGAADAHKVSP